MAGAGLDWENLAPAKSQRVRLMAGGLLVAPLGAYLARHVPARPLSAGVGLLVVGLVGLRQWQSLNSRGFGHIQFVDDLRQAKSI